MVMKTSLLLFGGVGCSLWKEEESIFISECHLDFPSFKTGCQFGPFVGQLLLVSFGELERDRCCSKCIADCQSNPSGQHGEITRKSSANGEFSMAAILAVHHRVEVDQVVLHNQR